MYSKHPYDSNVHASTVRANTAAGRPAMHYSAATKAHAAATGTALKVHPLLDPRHRNSKGELIRESLDSATSPQSRPIVVALDKTGSMQKVPPILFDKLSKLMKDLVKHGFIQYPHILTAAFDDVKFQRQVPIEISQFETGNETDDALSKIILTGNGGGNRFESADLILWFLANYSRLDCLDKRGEKGFLFIVSDEKLQPTVSRSEIKDVFDVDVEANIPLEDVMARLSEQYEVFYIMPSGAYYNDDQEITGSLKALFGERFINNSDPELICEVLIGLIAATEGFDVNDIKAALVDENTTADQAQRATDAIVPYAGGLTKKNTGSASEELVGAGSDAVDRI
jgi:hypothetical protein